MTPEQWRRYSRLDKPGTAPPAGQLVWVNEMQDHGVTVGVFDGFTFRILPGGSDDCHVTHWQPMPAPEPPPPAEVAAWDAEVDAEEERQHPEWFRSGDE